MLQWLCVHVVLFLVKSVATVVPLLCNALSVKQFLSQSCCAVICECRLWYMEVWTSLRFSLMQRFFFWLWIWKGYDVSRIKHVWYEGGVKSKCVEVCEIDESKSGCFRCLMFIFPGSVDLLISLCWLATWTCDVLSSIDVSCSLLMCLLLFYL